MEVTMRKMSTTLLAFSMLMAAPGAAMAVMKDGGFEVGPFLTIAHFDDESNIENDVGLGFRFGIVFVKQHELEFSVDFIATEDDFGGFFDVDLTTFKAGYVYNILPDGAVVPLLTAGLGFQTIEISEDLGFDEFLVEEETDPLAYAGVGVRFFIGPVFNIRVDGQAVAVFPDGGDQDNLVDAILNVGVGWVF
jgi:hypothetical protein